MLCRALFFWPRSKTARSHLSPLCLFKWLHSALPTVMIHSIIHHPTLVVLLAVLVGVTSAPPFTRFRFLARLHILSLSMHHSMPCIHDRMPGLRLKVYGGTRARPFCIDALAHLYNGVYRRRYYGLESLRHTNYYPLQLVPKLRSLPTNMR